MNKFFIQSIILHTPNFFIELSWWILLILVSPFNLSGQNLSIVSFNLVPLDLTSRTTLVKDNNSIPCALIKIICNDEITGVQGNVIKSEEYGNEYWVYLSPGTKQIRILTRHHTPIDFNIKDYIKNGVNSQSTYHLKLNSDLSPEILYGSSNPLAPVTMAKDTDSLFPRWWNTHEEGMYVGISLPTLDGESAKASAITNAIYSFIHSTGCKIIYHATIDRDYEDEDEESVSICKALKNGFTIRISQEYYNSKGEYFVLCAINPDIKSPSAMMIEWAFNDTNSDSSLSVNIAVLAQIHQSKFKNYIQYKVTRSANLYRYNLNCNGKNMIHNMDIEINDNISEFTLGGDVGLSQLRLLSTIPLLPDSLSFMSSYGLDNVFRQTIYGQGQSIPVNIRLSDYNINGLVFDVSEQFPNVKFISNEDNYIFSQVHGLSEKYNIEYLDSRGNPTAIQSDGFCENERFEVAKNKSILNALSGAIGYFRTQMESTSEPITEVFDKDSAILESISQAYYKAKIYPLYYLDSKERVDCIEKKYRKIWTAYKKHLPQMSSIVIRIESNKVNNSR